MKYEDFLFVGTQLQKQSKVLDDLYKHKVDLLDLMDPYHAIIDRLMIEVYGEEGAEWFSWFCYEADYGLKDWSESPSYKRNEDGTTTKIHEAGEPRHGAEDENGDPICYDWESLWIHLESLNTGTGEEQ